MRSPRFVLVILSLAAVVFWPRLFAAEPFLEKIDLFAAGTEGYATHRIPGIVVTKKGTVLAYCESRRDGGGDWGEIHVHLRRSLDGGQTWEPAKKIAHLGAAPDRARFTHGRKPKVEGEQTVNNPVAIVDQQTGAIHFLYCIEYALCFYQRSDDDGATWSPPIEITAALEQFRPEYPWHVVATGPAHGIQLKSGRLVVPVWLCSGTGGAHRPSVTATIFSDDHGATWQRGAIAVPNTAETVNPNETVVVELADGRVMLNVRSESKRHRRIVVTSPDGASDWSAPRFDEALWEPICMGSIVRLSKMPESDKNRILFANPHSLKLDEAGEFVAGSGRRQNLSVKLSYDEGQSWAVNQALEPGGSGYSDLAVLPEGTVLCLYERGRDGKANAGLLTVARFNLEWLTGGKDTLPAAPVSKTSAR